MPGLLEELNTMIASQLLERQMSVVGTVLSYDPTTQTVKVVCKNPSGKGVLKWEALPLPLGTRGVSGPAPEVNSQVSMIFPGGNPAWARITGLNPPAAEPTADTEKYKRPRTNVSLLTHN